MEKKMDKTLVIKFPNISTLSELHDKMNKTKVLRKLEKFPANLFLHDVGDFFQYSVFSLDDQGGLDIKNKKCERQLIGTLFDITLDSHILDSNLDSIMDEDYLLAHTENDPDVFDKLLDDYKFISHRLELAICKMYEQLIEYDFHIQLLKNRNPINPVKDYTDTYFNLVQFEKNKLYPSYVLHNVLPNHKNIFTRHEYSHLHDIYISPNSEKINDGYIDWVFDIAPDLPSDVKVSIIFTDNTKINMTIREVRSWRPVKKFKIIT